MQKNREITPTENLTTNASDLLNIGLWQPKSTGILIIEVLDTLNIHVSCWRESVGSTRVRGPTTGDPFILLCLYFVNRMNIT